MPFERPTRDLRASDADREATVERLRVAAMEGRLDADELEERLTAAYAARWCSELEGLTRDVTPPSALSPPAPLRPFFATQPRRTNGLAIASLFAAMFVWFGPAAALVAVVLGHVALNRIARSGGMQRGRALAVAGLTLGYLELLAMALWLLAGVAGSWHW
jgi:uncharacterized protein DUF1707/uncharacterized protein DUF4190